MTEFDNGLILAMKEEKAREILLKTETDFITFINSKGKGTFKEDQTHYEINILSEYEKSLLLKLAKMYNLEANTEKIGISNQQNKFQISSFNRRGEDQDLMIVFSKNENSQIPTLSLRDYIGREKKDKLSDDEKLEESKTNHNQTSENNNKYSEKINKSEDKPTIKGRGNFMWVSQNEIENQTDNEMWMRLNKLNINDDNYSSQNEENVSNFTYNSFQGKVIFNFTKKKQNLPSNYSQNNKKFNTEISKGNTKYRQYNNNNVSHFMVSTGTKSVVGLSNNVNSKDINKDEDLRLEVYDIQELKSNSNENICDIIIKEIKKENIHIDNLRITKIKETYLINCESIDEKRILLAIKSDKLRIRKFQDPIITQKLPSINIKAFQRMIHSHLNSVTKV